MAGKLYKPASTSSGEMNSPSKNLETGRTSMYWACIRLAGVNTVMQSDPDKYPRNLRDTMAKMEADARNIMEGMSACLRVLDKIDNPQEEEVGDGS